MNIAPNDASEVQSITEPECALRSPRKKRKLTVAPSIEDSVTAPEGAHAKSVACTGEDGPGVPLGTLTHVADMLKKLP